MPFLSLKPYKTTLLLVTALTIVCLDQATKLLIMENLPLFHSIPVIPDFFSITHIQNPGGAFGFLAESSAFMRQLMFLFVSSIASGCVLYFYFKTPKTHPWLHFSFALIFGGALGNMIDRFRLGQVIDFLDFYVGPHHWPAFNVADSAISVGMTIFVIHILFKKLPE